jgi:DNA-directed RNA polymerase specialized sigma24 family protein
MPKEPFGALLDFLRKTCAREELHHLTDSQLLKLFSTERHEAAFAVLMHRHGPLVVGVCKRVLGDSHSVEDAVQATFVVLARRARTIKQPERLANWLYGVA